MEINEDEPIPSSEETTTHASTWSRKILPFVTDNDPPLKKPNEPPKPTLKPLPREIRYTFLGDDET